MRDQVIARLQRLQAPQLHHEEEQAAASGPGGVQEVLPGLPEAHGAQGDAVGGRASGTGVRPVAQSWLEHRSPKPGVGGSNPSRPASPSRRKRRNVRATDGTRERSTQMALIMQRPRVRQGRAGRDRPRSAGRPGTSCATRRIVVIVTVLLVIGVRRRRGPRPARIAGVRGAAGARRCGSMMGRTRSGIEKDMSKKWYVVHTYSGHENKVKANLEKAIHAAGARGAVRPDPGRDRGLRRDEGREAQDVEAQDLPVLRA